MSDSITVIGNTNLDIVVPETADLPPAGTERIVPHIDIRLGGSAGNLAVRCAGLGQPTTLISRVGLDMSADVLESALQLPNLTSVLPRDPELASGVTVAIEAERRDRAFLSSLGAMAAMVPSDVPDWALSARFVALSGYFLLPGLMGDPMIDLFVRARAAGATTALDTGWPPPGWTPEVRDDLLRVLDAVDIFFPNEDELCGLTGSTDVPQAALDLARQTDTSIVVKRATRGAGFATPDGKWREQATLAMRTVDSTGAGDAFNAAFLVSILRDDDWDAALAAAVRYASRLVGTPPRLRGSIQL